MADSGTGASSNVVLITDGAPNGCNQDPVTIAAIAAEAKARADVMTFAVGMDGADFVLLDRIASAGGTNCGAAPACNVNGNGTSLVDALDKIRTTVTQPTTGGQGTKIGCQYSIPTPANGQKLDPTKLNVQITRNGTVLEIGQVAGAASCRNFANSGWYYDDPVNPKRVEFCSATCESIETPDGSATSSKGDILFGCQTERSQ